MKALPFQMVTLVEILETSAEAWWRLAGMVGQAIVKLEPHYDLGPNGAGAIGATLGEINREAQKLELRSALHQLKRMSEYITPRPGRSVVQSEIRQMMVDLHYRILEDLENRFFLSIPDDNVAFYRPSEPLFGSEVEAKFPMMSEDISEAGKCLALNRPTASVFHLMRLAEIAVQRFGDKLGVALATEKNWQNVLDEINKAIKALDQKAPITKAYAEAAAHLYNVKICWRNEVMHPKQTYTPEEARAVFDAARIFIRDLAGIL
jgi:hypothetical protein